MTTMPDEWLGFAAAAYAIFTAGIALWLAYGIRLGAWPLIVANAITLVPAGAVLLMKIRIDGRRWKRTLKRLIRRS